MNRSISNIKMDFLLQWRYGFYYAAAFITLVWIGLLSSLPQSMIVLALVLIIFTDLGIVGLIFIAGQIIFEKSERTLFALIVTPLAFKEYLVSKLVTLTIMAWVISTIVTLVVYGLNFNLYLFTIGVILTSLIALLVGLIAVAPYQSISNFLLPVQLYLIVMNLPIFAFLGWLTSPIFYLIPTHGSLILLSSAFQPMELWKIIYAVIYQIIWIILLYVVAERRFDFYIVAGKRGGR